MFPYYFIRFSGPLLLILIAMKILSGFALVGKFDGAPWLSSLHLHRGLDLALLFLFIFHAFYGLRLFLVDLGMMKRERLLFWTFTIIAIGLFALSYFYFF